MKREEYGGGLKMRCHSTYAPFVKCIQDDEITFVEKLVFFLPWWFDMWRWWWLVVTFNSRSYVAASTAEHHHRGNLEEGKKTFPVYTLWLWLLMFSMWIEGISKKCIFLLYMALAYGEKDWRYAIKACCICSRLFAAWLLLYCCNNYGPVGSEMGCVQVGLNRRKYL